MMGSFSAGSGGGLSDLKALVDVIASSPDKFKAALRELDLVLSQTKVALDEKAALEVSTQKLLAECKLESENLSVKKTLLQRELEAHVVNSKALNAKAKLLEQREDKLSKDEAMFSAKSKSAAEVIASSLSEAGKHLAAAKDDAARMAKLKEEYERKIAKFQQLIG